MKEILLFAAVFVLSLPGFGQTYEGDLTLERQAEVASFTYQQVTGTLTIRTGSGNDPVTSLRALSKLTAAGGLVLSSNPALTNLKGLENLQRLGDNGLYIENNAVLTDLQPLKSLTEIGGVVSKFVFSGGLRIADNAALKSLRGLEKVNSTSYLAVVNNPSLKDLQGLNGLQYVGDGGLSIRNNRGLKNLKGLEKLHTVDGFAAPGEPGSGGLFIEDNAALNSLKGLDNLRNIGEGFLGVPLAINRNPSLTDIQALSGLAYAGRLTVTGNTQLRACCVLSDPIYLLTPDATLANNAPGCNSQQEIAAACKAITAFSLVDAETDQIIQTLRQGDTVDLSALPNQESLTIVAQTVNEPLYGMELILQGAVTHTHFERYAPYALFGDKPGNDFAGRILPPGQYTLEAYPYSRLAYPGQQYGEAGLSSKISFTLITTQVAEATAVTSVDLYDVVTDKKLMELQEGAAIQLSGLQHQELAILANTSPAFAGSVSLSLSGPVQASRVENTKPYTLFRNNSKDLFGRQLLPGNYTLTATLYSQPQAKGVKGTALTLHFSVVGKTVNTQAAESMSALAYPVPFTDRFALKASGFADSQQMELYDIFGQRYPLQTEKTEQEIICSGLGSLKAGTYVLRITDSAGIVQHIRVCKE